MDGKRSQKLDVLDSKIAALFEQRLALAGQEAMAMTKRGLKRQARLIGAQAVEKATCYSCDAYAVSYIEELMKLLLCASYKYQRRLLRRKEKAGRPMS